MLDFLDLSGVIEGAAAANSDPEFAQPRNAETITSNAADSMQPITTQGGGWGDFWSGVGNTVLNHAISRDSIKTNAEARAEELRAAAGATTAPQPQQGIPPMLLIGGGVLLVLLAFMAMKR